MRLHEEFQYTKGVTGIRKLKKDRQHNGHGQTCATIYKTLHKKLKIE